MTDVATSLGREREEQGRWRLLPQYSGVDIFDRLLENEFRDPEENRHLQEAERVGFPVIPELREDLLSDEET